MPSHRLAHLLAAVLLLVRTAAAQRPRPADLILTNARVYTLAWPDPARDGTPAATAPYDRASGWHPDAEAVAIRGAKIRFVGSARDVSRFRGPRTRIVDLRGRTVVPGLIDAHVHLSELGANLTRVNLAGAPDESTAVNRVVERARTVTKGKWITGSGWDEGAWANRYPTMALLSRRVPDNPVYLRGLHGYAAWGNALAFRLAGITAETQPPPGGTIVKDAAGQPTGILLNTAVSLLARAVPPREPAELERDILAALRAMRDAGYVSVDEAGVDSTELAAYQALDRAHRLPIRVHLMLAARDTALLRRWLTRGPDTSLAMLTIRGVKAFADGALGSRGARLLADYTDRPGHRGTTGGDLGYDTALVAAMMRRGFQVSIHSIGDAANRESLDFFQSVERSDPASRATRPRIEHAQVLAPADIPRFDSLGVLASMQPSHAVEDMAWAEQRLGPERIIGAYAWRTLRMSGARLLLSSDLPATDYDIFYGLHSAIARQDRRSHPTGGWYPAQRLTPEEALRGFTSWGAYAEFDEAREGRIAPGMNADLTVLIIDPLVVGSTDPARLLDGKVALTIVDGRIAHDATRATALAR